MKKLLFVALVVILSLASAVPVMAEVPPADVPTEGEVTGGTIPPVIQYKWELPDDDPVTPGCQIIPPAGTWDPTTAVETEGVNPLVVWAVVCDEEGIGDIMTVYNEVWEPGAAAYKWQEVMVEVTVAAEIEQAKIDAVASEQITQAQADEIDLKWSKGECKIFKYEGQIDTHQPSGTWTVEVYATDTGGSTSTRLINTFGVIGILAFAIDFDVVDWGSFKPNITDTVSGNEIMEPMPNAPGENNNPPTIKNLGNDPFTLKLMYDPMIGTTDLKVIDKFDATFMGVSIDPMDAGTWYTWPTTAKLERCHATQIDFSVHPSSLVTTDTYVGALHLTIVDP
jgi:hypothetical protein